MICWVRVVVLAGLFAGLAAAQCGKLVINPATGELDCSGTYSGYKVSPPQDISPATDPNAAGTTGSAPGATNLSLAVDANHKLWFYDGAAWQKFQVTLNTGAYTLSAATGTVNTGTAAARPATPADGYLYCATDTHVFTQYSAILGWGSQLNGVGYAVMVFDPTSGIQVYPSNSCTPVAPGGGTIAHVTNLIAGDGAGNGVDSGIAPSAVVKTNATNTFTAAGYSDMHSGAWRPPETAVAGLPAAAGSTGKTYLVTDGSAVGDCATGSGTTPVGCRSNGTSWVCIWNCSGGGSAITLTAPLPLWGFGASSSVVSPTANKVWTTPKCFETSISTSNITANITTLAAGGNLGFAVADTSGNKLFESGSVSTAATGAIAASWVGGSKTLAAGCYEIWESADNSTVAISIHTVGSGIGTIIDSVANKTLGNCTGVANFGAAAGSVFPLTCGAVNTTSTWAYPEAALQ